MTTYSWPTTGVHPYLVSSLTWRQIHNNRRSNSSLNGTTQTTSLPGSRWGVTLDFPTHTYAQRAELEGFLSRLSGMEHRLSLWDLARSDPSLLSGLPTVSGAVAQFAQTLSIANGRAGRNLALNTRFMVDSNADGLADNWTIYNNLAVSATASLVDGLAGNGQRVLFNAASTNTHGIIGVPPVSGWLAGQYYVISFYARKLAGAAFTGCQLNWNIPPTTAVISNPALTTTYQRYAYRVFWPLGTTLTSNISLWITRSGSSAAGDALDICDVQVEAGFDLTDYTGPPSLIPGDWLRLVTGTGNQLVKVVNTTAGETLSGVEFRPMLRGSVTNGSAITITRPSALFTLAQPELAIPRGASGICPPFSLDLVEVFA